MQQIRGIRIENLFWMLAYAWNEVSAARAVSVSLDRTGAPLDPIVACFLTGSERLVRQGLHQNFIKKQDRLAAIRGRIVPTRTMRDGGGAMGRVWCEYDRVSIDILPNQVLRTALRRIDESPGIGIELRRRARALDRRFEGVAILDDAPRDFSIVNAGGQKRGYRFLLALAKVILTGLAPVGYGVGGEFAEVDVESTVHSVFERFVRNYLDIHLDGYKVRRTRRTWSDVEARNEQAGSLLPNFETDVVITKPGRTIVIDTKFYARTLRENWGVERVREAHMYQLLGYLHNMNRSGQWGDAIEGVLLYPLAQQAVDARWIIHGYPVRVLTIDLSRTWDELGAQLLELGQVGAGSENAREAAGTIVG